MTGDNVDFEDDFDDQDVNDQSGHDEFDDEDDIEYVSKTQIKQEMQALRDLGKELIAMPDNKLAKLPLSDRLFDAIKQARGFKMKALKRQIQHIGVIMREEDVDAIRAGLETEAQKQQREKRAFHQLENWRDELVGGDKETLNQVIDQFPSIDRQYLMQLIRNAGKEKKLNKPPKSARTLFTYLRKLYEQENG